jgi:hypothetical protein
LSDCPLHFSIDEYKALAALPLGHSVVYTNILAQLAIPSVDFTKIETQCMVLQTVLQTGPPSQCIERSGHTILTEVAFGHAMLAQLESNLDRIRENWESWRAAATFSLLARRVLSLTRALDVRRRATDYLETLRGVCSTWLRRLKERVAVSTDDSQRTELWSRATEVALLCTSTYDVEETEFETTLQSESAISTLLQASIVVHEHCGSVESDFPELFRISLHSWKLLMYRILPNLRQHLLKSDDGLSHAVKNNWAAFESTSSNSWASLDDKSQQHWMLTTSGSLPVHFNLLTGELLVDGLPLARLPAEYMRHKMYEPLFCKSALEVVPTNEVGLRFSARSLYHGYNLHFGMKGNDILLSAIGHGTRFELVPSHLFQNLLPQSLVTNVVHWYDVRSEEVLFRPLHSPWSTEDDDARWRLVRHGASWQLVSNEKKMISVRSRTARIISSMLAPLEKPLQILVRLVGPDHTLQPCVEIELPRLQISFEFNQGNEHVWSRQFRDMVIDSDQTMDALVGMQSKLILRSAEGRRMIIIPEGLLTFTKTTGLHHLKVTITEDSATRIRAYHIDETLGQITGDGSFRSRLILCYLHALTSHCLPDPLTGLTGTESAMSILGSAAVRSIDILTPEDIVLLTRLADLSASRSYYPEHLRVMQSTKWNIQLPSLSQHSSFRILVSSLLQQVGKMQFFYPPDKHEDFKMIRRTQQELTSSSNAYLDARSSIRTSAFQVASFGAENFTSTPDLHYDARDIQSNSQRGKQASLTANLILRDHFNLHSQLPDLRGSLLQKHFKGSTVLGANSSFDLRSLRYDSKWLGSASERVIEHWCTVQAGLNGVTTNTNRYDIATWLCTMSYAETSDMDVIQAFAAFYRSRELIAEPPTARNFELAQGYAFNKMTIQTAVQNNTKPFEESEEARLERKELETEEQHHIRMESLFRDRKISAIQRFVRSLEEQWPVQIPTVPVATAYDTYLNVDDAMTAVRRHFHHWYNNYTFMKYLGQLSAVVARQSVSPVLATCHIITSPPKKGQLNDYIRHFSVSDVFATAPPNLAEVPSLTAPSEPVVTVARGSMPEKQSQVKERLEELCRRNMLFATSKCERDYVESLRSSCNALDSFVRSNVPQDELVSNAQALLQDYLHSCQNHFDALNSALKGLLSSHVAYQMQLSPRISTKFWLSQLHRDRFDTLSSPWKHTVIQYALAITNLQRAQRLVCLSNKPVDLIEEIRHVGHEDWDGHQYPETLLIEAESAIIVRKEQEYIADQMRSPKDDQNLVLQLLMGGGKSTTIIPILSAFHGNKQKYVVKDLNQLCAAY